MTDPSAYEAVSAAVKAAGIPTVMSEVTMVASTYTKLEGSAANQMIRLLEALEDNDDTQNVYSNFDMDRRNWKQRKGGTSRLHLITDGSLPERWKNGEAARIGGLFLEGSAYAQEFGNYSQPGWLSI